MSSVTARPRGAPHSLWKPRLGRHAPHVAEHSLLRGTWWVKAASRALSAQDFLKWNVTSPAWFLTFPDQRGGGWEVLARKFSGP